MGWELTLACNLRCKHCGSSAGQPRLAELTKKEAFQICDQFPELLVQEVDFTGGEPLLRPDWKDIALYLKNMGITTKILTNGVALDSNAISAIKDAGISGVGISLDGIEKTHDSIRGHQGSFRQVLRGIEMVLKAGIPLTVITTANAFNIDELPFLFNLLHSLSVKRWRVQPIIPFGRVENSREMMMDEATYLQLENFVEQWVPRARNEGMELLRSDGLGYLCEDPTDDRPWRGCPAGIVSCGITSNGRVKGCLSLPDSLIEGDLRKKDLWDIWFNPSSFAYTRQFSADKMGLNCMSCVKAEDCRGGCTAKSYGNTGQFHNDPYCLQGIYLRNQEIVK